MPAAILIALAVLALLAAAVELSLPRLAAARVERRLTESGGVAAVEIAAFPALRLLRNGGDRIVVRGTGVTVGLSGAAGGGLAALDGFAEVDVELIDFRAGPFDVAAFVLAGTGAGSYAMAAEGRIAAIELVALGDRLLRAALPGGSVLEALAGVTPLDSRSLPFTIAVDLQSEPSGLRASIGGGSIGAYPVGPVASTIAAAVARRLEIVP
jgi:hypothetical protein